MKAKLASRILAAAAKGERDPNKLRIAHSWKKWMSRRAWLKSKNPASEAVRREREEEWR